MIWTKFKLKLKYLIPGFIRTNSQSQSIKLPIFDGNYGNGKNLKTVLQSYLNMVDLNAFLKFQVWHIKTTKNDRIMTIKKPFE